MGKHSGEGRSVAPVIVAAVGVIGIAVVVLAVVRLGSGTGSATSASAPVVVSTGTSTTSPTSMPSAAPTTSVDAALRAALQSCVDRQAAAKGVVDAITAGATHWSDHVQGETDLESGARSLIDVKTTTWAQTRAAGPGDVAAFTAAQAAYAAVPACPVGATQLAAPVDLMARMQGCATREQALDTVVATGTQVMGDWATHLTEMADHADGHIAGPPAQANWIKRYQAAPQHLKPYRDALVVYSAAPGCTT